MEVFGENPVFLHAWRVDAAVVALICLETCGGMGKWRFLAKTMCLGKWRFLVENVGFYMYLEVDTAVV